MVPTSQQLLTISGNDPAKVVIAPATVDNVNSLITSLRRWGAQFGLDLPHRLAHLIAQLAEESGGWKWDRELASGAEYEGRANLGNTEKGDGVRFKGRTMAQLTGRANYHSFTLWARANVDHAAPDFEAQPDLLNTDPWEGLVPIWFWATRKLNAYADENNVEQITKLWNGGLNGFDVRVHFYVRAALVLLGASPDNIVGFQRAAQAEGLLPPGEDQLDGDAGPKTRAAMHQKLIELSPAWVTGATKVAPVTEKIVTTVTKEVPVDKPVAVAAKGSTSRTWLWSGLSTISVSSLVSGFADVPWQYKVAAGVVALATVVIMLFLGDRIIRRTKALISEINAPN